LNGSTIAIASILIGVLQAICLAVLGGVWGEIRTLRTRVHKLENEVANLVTLENMRSEFQKRKL
jgi:hypothetical protein